MNNLIWAEEKTFGWLRGPQVPQLEVALHAGCQDLMGADKHHSVQTAAPHTLCPKKKKSVGENTSTKYNIISSSLFTFLLKCYAQYRYPSTTHQPQYHSPITLAGFFWLGLMMTSFPSSPTEATCSPLHAREVHGAGPMERKNISISLFTSKIW